MKHLRTLFAALFISAIVMPSCVHAFTERSVVVLRVLNKAAGKTQTVRVAVGGTTKFEKLTITARSCKQTDPFEAENFFAFMEISEPTQGKIFGNWMNRNEPGQNPVQNPDYDVWLASCE